MNDRTGFRRSSCSSPLRAIFPAVVLMVATGLATATDLDTIGVILLRQIDPTLLGTGINVAQAEADTGGGAFEVNPNAVGQPETLFTYASDNGTGTGFPNSVGTESAHADSVGWNFYGSTGGVAKDVSHVDNYDAGYFYNNVVSALLPPVIQGQIVNQSFVFSGSSGGDPTVEQHYDDYAAHNGTLFVSGAGNGGVVAAPSTAYNGLSVGVFGASSSIGPTTDGRCKPDLTAPGGATSFSTPYVSGAAAVLLQAAKRGDGGSPTGAPSDLRTQKALLLNGAVKPGAWTNSTDLPLDARYGAGIVNVFNSWKQLTGGRHAFIEGTSNPPGSPHPPGSNTANEPVLVGWGYNTIANVRSGLVYQERVNHYYFNLDPTLGSAFTATATLVWNRLAGRSGINDLNLFLFNAASGNLITCSTSAVNNVEHVFQVALPPGRYDLQVHKDPAGQVSASETYALAFEFFNMKLSLVRTNDSFFLSWPIAPAGFALESTTALVPPVTWAPVPATGIVTNNQNVVSLPATGNDQFFRLRRP